MSWITGRLKKIGLYECSTKGHNLKDYTTNKIHCATCGKKGQF